MGIATTRAARPVWQQPVVQFVVVGLVVAVFLAWITGVLGERLAQEQAIDDARSTTALLAETVAEPALSSGLLDTQAGDLDRFDRLVRSRVLRGEVVRVKVWDAEGRIVYSDEPRLIDQTFTLGADEREVLANGGSDAEVSDLSKSENTWTNSSAGCLRCTRGSRLPMVNCCSSSSTSQTTTWKRAPTSSTDSSDR